MRGALLLPVRCIVAILDDMRRKTLAILCDAYRTRTPTEVRARVLSTAHGPDPPVPHRPKSSALNPAILAMSSRVDSTMYEIIETLMTVRARASCFETEATRVLAIKNSTSTSPWQRAPAEAKVQAMTATAHNDCGSATIASACAVSSSVAVRTPQDTHDGLGRVHRTHAKQGRVTGPHHANSA